MSSAASKLLYARRDGATGRDELAQSSSCLSELDADARRRVDRLGRVVAVRQTRINVGHHDAGVDIHAFDRTPIDEEGDEVRRAGALAAVESRDGEGLAVWLDAAGDGRGAGRGQGHSQRVDGVIIVVLAQPVVRASQVELVFF